MKRKLCSVLLALCMVLTLLPVSAMADDGAEASQVATQLPLAVDGVVTLESDTSISATALQSAIANGLEINLNSKTLTITSAGSVSIPKGKTVKFYNGTILNSTFTRGDYATFAADEGATLIVDNVTMNTTGSAFFPAGNASAVTVTNSSITAGVYVIGTNASGNLSDNVIITLKDSTLTSTGYQNTDRDTCTVMINVPGTMNIDNCKIYGGRQVLFVRCGTATVNNSTITLSNAYNDAGKYDSKDWSSGNEVPMGAVVVGNRTNGTAYDTPATCTLNNTTVTGGRVYTYQKDEIAVKLNITGNSTINGAFVNGDGENGKATIVTESGTYSDLSALDYLADSANVTVKLAADTTKDVTIPAGANVILDLNGYKLTNASGHTITNNGNLTVTGNGTVQNNADEKQTVYNNPGAVATLNGGHYEKPNTHGYVILNHGTMTANSGVSMSIWSDTHSSLFENGWYNTKDNPSLTINGGTYDGGLNTIKNDDDAVLTINGGTFTNYTQAAFQNHGTAVVNGGTFTANSWYSIDNCGCDATHDPGKLTITNGTFTGTLYVRSQFSDVSISGGTFTGDITKTGGSLSLSGGTYTSDPTAYVASGAIARKDGDAQYTVVAKSNLTSGVYTSDPSSALAPGYVSYANNDGSYTVYPPAAPSTSTSTTTKNPDGSTTTTTTDKTTGTVTETTKNTDGSTTTTETKKDGSVTETNKTANSSVGTVKTDANGNSEISASISAADVNAAAKKNEPVAAPVSVAPAASSAAAPVIKLSVPASAGAVSVVIPVTNAQQGTVAVKVNPDGTEEIIKTSVVTKDGVVLGVEGSAQIKIVNNDKDFADTVGHWAESDVDFVSARELFTGTASQTFSPESATTRGMVVTVLARLAGENTDGGANWYDKGCAWAVTNGVSDGTDPNGTVTREQLAAMLYRYFGSPAVSGSLSFADASSVSEYAHDAMQWCVNNGIINGMDGLLNPQGQATRAQVSAMFARYIRLMATK